VAHLANNKGAVRLHLTLTPRTLPDAVSYNVIADFKGSEQLEQVVIVSGHLDSWDLGTGATDDGAGVAIAMQTMLLLRQLNLRPKRTIRMIAWMSEEYGGLRPISLHSLMWTCHVSVSGGIAARISIFITLLPTPWTKLSPKNCQKMARLWLCWPMRLLTCHSLCRVDHSHRRK
jgi:hypothetical protein